MRPIKFRIWNKTTNKYIYSDEFSGDQTLNLYFFFKFIEDMRCCGDEFLDLEQFTGLYDAEENPIYEGDIVNKQYHNLSIIDGIGVVKMDVGADSDGYNHQEWYGWMAGDCSLLDVHRCCKVIGSIHENPELLETK